MSATFLLVIIYLAFIGLGLPDSLLGAAWPAAHAQLGADVSWAGAVNIITAVGTVISSLLSEKLIRRFGTATVTSFSIALTAFALFGVSHSGSFYFMLLFAIPLGMGAGTVDSALNNYVALHYRASHMNWLHCFWGVGASLGPLITAAYIARGAWRGAYFTIALILSAIAFAVLASYPLWKKNTAGGANEADATGEKAQDELPAATSKRTLIKLPGAVFICLAFFAYCGAESSTGLWASSFFVSARGIPEETAAAWGSLFFIGITAGRFFSGFAALRFSNKAIIRAGEILLLAGALLLFILPGSWGAAALAVTGLGCAPVFPSLLDETPRLFSKKYSQGMMGLQLACAYAGSTVMATLFGVLGRAAGFWVFPLYVLLLAAALIAATALTYKRAVAKA